jgi:hypothetical protein
MSSKISIISNKIPTLKMPKFSVDTELDSKLNDYEITSLMNKSNFTLFLGKAGSGKSSLLISFLQTPSLFKKVYHNIFLFMPSNSRNSIRNGFFDKNLPADQIYDDVTLENLQAVYDASQEAAKDDLNTLLIFDDVQKYLKGENEKLLLHMINNRRHARISIWFACQTYASIPRQIRQGLTNLFIFKVNKVEMENIFLECIEQHKKSFLDIINFVYDKNHNFLFLDTNSQRLFKNWDEIILSSDNV